MESFNNPKDKTLAMLIHLSVFTQFFIPLGNFIFPVLLWLVKREDRFVDQHGRNAVNFQISIFLYFVFITALGIFSLVFAGINLGLELPFNTSHHPFHLKELSQVFPLIILIGVFALLLLGLFILEIFAVITASIKASNGEYYNYPLSINFIKAENKNHQSKNEQSNNIQNDTL